MKGLGARLNKLEAALGRVLTGAEWVEMPYYDYFMLTIQSSETRQSELREEASAWFAEGIDSRWQNRRFYIRRSSFETMPQLDKTLPEWQL